MIRQYVDVLFVDGELMLGDTLRLYKGDNGILISVKVEKQYYKNNKLVSENVLELGKYGRAIIRKAQPDCPLEDENIEENPVFCSEAKLIENGRLDILIPADAIDESKEIGIHQIQIQLYGGLDDDLGRPRLTLDPFEFEVSDLISEDMVLEDPLFDDENAIASVSEVDKAKLLVEEEKILIQNSDGSYNKTEWVKGDIITASKLNKVEETIDKLYGIRPHALSGGSLNEYIATMVNNLDTFPKIGDEIHIMLASDVYVELNDSTRVIINSGSEKNTAKFEITLSINLPGFSRCKLKLTLTTPKELIIAEFDLTGGDTKARLTNNAIHRLESVDLASLATAEYVDEAIENIDTLEVFTVGNDSEAMLLDEGDGYVEFNYTQLKPYPHENHFVFKRIKVTADEIVYFNDSFVCVVLSEDSSRFNIKEINSGKVWEFEISEEGNRLLNVVEPATKEELPPIKVIGSDDINNPYIFTGMELAGEFENGYFSSKKALISFKNVVIECRTDDGVERYQFLGERLGTLDMFYDEYEGKKIDIIFSEYGRDRSCAFMLETDNDIPLRFLWDIKKSYVSHSTLEEYATKDDLANIEIPEVDLTGVATEEYVNNAVSNIKYISSITIDTYVLLRQTFNNEGPYNLKDVFIHAFENNMLEVEVLNGVYYVSFSGSEIHFYNYITTETLVYTQFRQDRQRIERKENIDAKFATQSYVDTAISNIPVVDTSNFATKDEIPPIRVIGSDDPDNPYVLTGNEFTDEDYEIDTCHQVILKNVEVGGWSYPNDLCMINVYESGSNGELTRWIDIYDQWGNQAYNTIDSDGNVVHDSDDRFVYNSQLDDLKDAMYVNNDLTPDMWEMGGIDFNNGQKIIKDNSIRLSKPIYMTKDSIIRFNKTNDSTIRYNLFGYDDNGNYITWVTGMHSDKVMHRDAHVILTIEKTDANTVDLQSLAEGTLTISLLPKGAIKGLATKEEIPPIRVIGSDDPDNPYVFTSNEFTDEDYENCNYYTILFKHAVIRYTRVDDFGNVVSTGETTFGNSGDELVVMNAWIDGNGVRRLDYQSLYGNYEYFEVRDDGTIIRPNDSADWYVYYSSLENYVTKNELSTQLGNIDAILDAINGEVI